MSIRQKIGLSFLIIIGLFSSLGGYVIYSKRIIANQLTALDQRFEQIVELGSLKLEHTGHLVLNMQETQLALHEIVLGDRDARVRYDKSMEEFNHHHQLLVSTYREIARMFEKLNETSHENLLQHLTELERIKQEHELFRTKANQTILLAHHGDSEQAESILEDVLEKDISVLADRVLHFEVDIAGQIDDITGRFDEAIHNVVHIIERLRIISIFLIIASVLIAAALVQWLSKIVTRPVHDIALAAESIERGQFDISHLKPLGDRRDEFGVTARVFQRMASQVEQREQKLRQQVQKLTIRVDRTKEKQQVAEITETDFFQALEKKANELRLGMNNSKV